MYIKPPFSDETASNKKKTKLTLATEYMYEVELFHQSSSRILQKVFPDRQYRSRSDCTDCTV